MINEIFGSIDRSHDSEGSDEDILLVFYIS